MKFETTPIPGLEDAAAYVERFHERDDAYAALMKTILAEHECPYTYEYPFVQLDERENGLWHLYHEWGEVPRYSEVALQDVMDDHVFAYCGDHAADHGGSSKSNEFTFSCSPPTVERLCRACLDMWWRDLCERPNLEV